MAITSDVVALPLSLTTSQAQDELGADLGLWNLFRGIGGLSMRKNANVPLLSVPYQMAAWSLGVLRTI